MTSRRLSCALPDLVLICKLRIINRQTQKILQNRPFLLKAYIAVHCILHRPAMWYPHACTGKVYDTEVIDYITKCTAARLEECVNRLPPAFTCLLVTSAVSGIRPSRISAVPTIFKLNVGWTFRMHVDTLNYLNIGRIKIILQLRTWPWFAKYGWKSRY